MRYGIAITTHNRYEYLDRFLESFSLSHILDETEIIISDDCSSDDRVLPRIQDFYNKRSDLSISCYKNEINIGSKSHYVVVMSQLTAMGCDYLINIDSDCLLNPFWMIELDKLLSHFDYQALGSVFHTDTSKTTDPTNWEKDYNDKYIEKKNLNGLGLCFPAWYVKNWESEWLSEQKRREEAAKAKASILVPHQQQVLFHDGRYESTLLHFDAYINKKKEEYGMRSFCTRISYIDHIGEFGVNSRPGQMFDRAIDFIGEKNE